MIKSIQAFFTTLFDTPEYVPMNYYVIHLHSLDRYGLYLSGSKRFILTEQTCEPAAIKWAEDSFPGMRIGNIYQVEDYVYEPL